MKCPYCGEELERYEVWNGYTDDDIVEAEEHWQCTDCHRIFSRMVTYKAIKKGMLEE